MHHFFMLPNHIRNLVIYFLFIVASTFDVTGFEGVATLPVTTGQDEQLPLFHALPDAVIAHLWHNHGYRDIRPLVATSRGVRETIQRASTLRYRFHVLDTVPSILRCVDMMLITASSLDGIECLTYWENRVSHLSSVQAFAVRAGMHLSQPRSNHSAWNSFARAVETRLSPTHMGALHYLTTLLILNHYASTVERLLPYWETPQDRHDMQITARKLLSKALRPFFRAMITWDCVWTEDPRTPPARTYFLTLSRIHGTLCQAVGDEVEETIAELHESLRDIIGDPYVSFYSYVQKIERGLYEMDLNSPKGVIVSYPSRTTPLEDMGCSRIVDMYLFPRLAWRLAIAVVVQRRLDLLHGLIRDEGLLFVARSPTFMASFLGLPRESMDEGERGEEEGFNFLAWLMWELKREALTPTSPRPHQHHHASWNPLTALQIVLENGGIRYKYDRLVSDAVSLGRLDVMIYLVRELHLTEGLSPAIHEAEFVHPNPEISAFLRSMLP